MTPLGAPIWLDGTRDGRPLAPAVVFIGEQGTHPATVPFALPAAEIEGVRTENVFAPPRTGAPGLHVWLAPAEGHSAPASVSQKDCEQLHALGYMDCPGQ